MSLILQERCTEASFFMLFPMYGTVHTKIANGTSLDRQLLLRIHLLEDVNASFILIDPFLITCLSLSNHVTSIRRSLHQSSVPKLQPSQIKFPSRMVRPRSFSSVACWWRLYRQRTQILPVFVTTHALISLAVCLWSFAPSPYPMQEELHCPCAEVTTPVMHFKIVIAPDPSS